MVLTILEAEVEKQNWQTLQDTYANMTKEVPPEIKQSFLVQSQSNKSCWRILTFWENQAALTAMRESSEIPIGVLIFQKVNTTPSLEILDIEQSTKRF
jgi:hypothetical protein